MRVSYRMAWRKARERIENPAKGQREEKDQVFDGVGQGVEIPPVLDLGGDPVPAGQALDRAPEVGHQEVMEGPLPAAHPGADRLLLDVLGKSSSFLGELGMEGSGEIAGGVEGMLISFEEHLLGVLAASLWLEVPPTPYS